MGSRGICACRAGAGRAGSAWRVLLLAAGLPVAGCLGGPAPGAAARAKPALTPPTNGGAVSTPAAPVSDTATVTIPAAAAGAAPVPAAPAGARSPHPAGAAVSPLSNTSEWRAAAASGPLSTVERQQRRRRFLELALRQMRRLEQIEHRLNTQRLGSGALTAAALAELGARSVAGGEGGQAAVGERGGRAAAGEGSRQAAAGPGGQADGESAREAVRWTEQLLEDCAGHWERGECARAELPLQRIVLRFPGVLPPALLARAREEAADAAPPPTPAEAASPWDFSETENQRAITIARSVVAAVVAGRPDSPEARAWSAYAAAFLIAHDRDGWYEAESPGYMAISVTALAHLADHAPASRVARSPVARQRPPVRELARRQLDLLAAAWAQQQVSGYPAGARSRTYVQWALGDRTTPWRAWAWLAAEVGNPARIAFSDWPELALADYEVPDPVALLLRGRRVQPPYEIRAHRHYESAGRANMDAATYSYATPDYILGVVQAVGRLRLAVSGGEEIAATLYPEGDAFAPLYLWSRTRNTPAERWKSWAENDLTVGAGPSVIAYLGAGEPSATGHAYLAAGWSRPEPAGEGAAPREGGETGRSGVPCEHCQTLVAHCGDTYVALTTDGDWEVAPAPRRFPDYYGDGFAGSWVAVPRRQPAAIGLLAGRRAEDGDFAAWRRRAARTTLRRVGARLELTRAGGPVLAYIPGKRATLGGQPLRPGGYPPLSAPFLSIARAGIWEFSFAGIHQRFEPLPVAGPAPRPGR